MDTLTTTVSALKVPNFNSTAREFCHLKTPTRQPQLPPHLFSTAKTTAASFTLKNLLTSPHFSTSSQPSPLISSPYTHRQPASGYAAALLDIAQCKGSLNTVQKDVKKLLKLFQNDQIRAFLSDPFVGAEDKGKAVKELARKGKFNKHLLRLLKMLIERNKLEMVSQVLQEFERIYDEMSDAKLVWISSEKKMEEDTLLRIVKRVKKLSGAVKVKVCNFLVKDNPPLPLPLPLPAFAA